MGGSKQTHELNRDNLVSGEEKDSKGHRKSLTTSNKLIDCQLVYKNLPQNSIPSTPFFF